MKQIIENDYSYDCYQFLNNRYYELFEAMYIPGSGDRDWFSNVDEIVIITPVESDDELRKVLNAKEFKDVKKRNQKTLKFIENLYNSENIKYKIFDGNSSTKILEYLDNKECLFLTNYLGPVSLQIIPELKKKKFKTIVDYDVKNNKDEDKIFSIRKVVEGIDRRYLVTDNIWRIDQGWGLTSLIYILSPDIYYDYKKLFDSTKKIFVVSDSKVLTSEFVKLLIPPHKIQYYQSSYENIPKEFGKEYDELVLTNLDTSSIENLNKINYRISKWIDSSKNQKIILQGNRKSYSVFENFGYELVELPKFNEFRNKITEIFIYFFETYECHLDNEGCFSTYYRYNELIKDNALVDLLRYFKSFDQMNEAFSKIKSRQYLFDIYRVECWEDLLIDTGEEPSSIRESETFYTFKHNTITNMWEILLPNKIIPDKLKYKNNLGVKYLLFITKNCNGKKMKVKKIVEDVSKWHGKKINSVTNNDSDQNTTGRHPLAHRIESNFTILKKRIPDLKIIIKRITLEDTCYYDADITNKISIKIDDPTFLIPPKSRPKN